MRVRLAGIGVLVVLLLPAAPASAANQTVTATPSNQFVAKHVGVNVGEMVTWNNGGGLHNVHFDDNSFDMPPNVSTSAWSVQRTFTTPGVYGYYCEAHGGPGGSGMSGTVAVNAGYIRPQSAATQRTSLVPAFKPCALPGNRTHGPPLTGASCNPPVQESDWVTVGTPDANGPAANSSGSVKLVTQAGTAGPPDEADVLVTASITDVRNKSGLADYTGQLQARLVLRVTDRYSGPSTTEPATWATTINFTLPCAATGGAAGSNCSASTSVDAVIPGAVLEGKRSVWQTDKAQVFDGGSDGLVSTTPNTLFAVQGVFIP